MAVIKRRDPFGDPISASEFGVAYLYAFGFCAKQIGSRYGIKSSAVKDRIKRVYLKLGIHSKLELIAYFEKEGV